MSVTVKTPNPYGRVKVAQQATGAQPAFNPAQQAFKVTTKLPTWRNAFMRVFK